MSSEPLVSVRGLTKHFVDSGGLLGSPTTTYALNDVSLDIREGEVVGVVGESGCGKSTLGNTLLQLIEPTSGEVYFDGEETTAMDGKELRRLRKDTQIIFQDASSALNPRHKIQRIVDEPLREHTSMSREERRDRVAQLLEDVDLKAEHADRYPHEFSGGQQQRISIARALALNPRFIVADEPMSALDLSTKAQLIQLLDRLQEEYDLTYLLITHDMNTVQQITDRTLVMYLGEVIERGPTDRVFQEPKHPYTEALVSAIPTPGRRRSERIVLEGDVPDPQDPPSGCPFHTRCHRYIGDVCEEEKPELTGVDGQELACHLYDEDKPGDPIEHGHEQVQ
ncbi:ABC transporter ATP-binding protein [Halobaculum sp. EA56]|uniref:ABC transporter ATP-binding protein n=1 Tax=Halobaculum sp. EA56 TaxID=3421648 RepID=UPI003EBC06BE